MRVGIKLCHLTLSPLHRSQVVVASFGSSWGAKRQNPIGSAPAENCWPERGCLSAGAVSIGFCRIGRMYESVTIPHACPSPSHEKDFSPAAESDSAARRSSMDLYP
jgi:hypothetical protein